MTEKNILLTKNTKFQTARVGCFFRLPLTEKNISYMTLLSLYQTNVSKKYPEMLQFEERLGELYDLDVAILPVIRGNQLIYNFEFEFIEPDLIKDESYTYEMLLTEFREMLTQPLFGAKGEKAFEMTKAELADEIDEYFDSPENVAYYEFFNKLYSEYPDFGAGAFGNPAIIEKITLAELSDFYQMLLQQPRVFLGNVKDTELVGNYLGNNLSELTTSTDFAVKSIGVPVPTAKSEQIVNEFGANQTQLFLGFGWQELLPTKKGMVPNVLAMYLGGDEYSILFRKIREEMGAVYSIDALNLNYSHLIVINAGIQKDKVTEVEKAIQEIMDDIAAGKIDETVLEKAKQSLLRRRLMSRDHQKSLIHFDLMGQLRTQTLDFATVNQSIADIQAADLQELVQDLSLLESYVLRWAKIRK